MRENRNLESMQFAAFQADENSWHQQLVEAWNLSDVQGFEAAIGNNFETLKKEKQLGLAKRLLQSLVQKKIADLSATYITLSFNEIAQKTGLQKDNLEEQITKMISEDVIKAKINTNAQTVEFTQDEDSGSGVSSAQLDLIQTLEK